MIIKPKVRGFVCITTHPAGCEANVKEQIEYVKNKGSIAGGPKNVLVIGASTGYGLASRITAAYGCGASTTGVFLEREPTEKRPATAGWYNSIAFEKYARADGMYARSINGDAFSDEIKARTVEALKSGPGPVDLVVYSLASPVRTHPKSGETHRSVLKWTRSKARVYWQTVAGRSRSPTSDPNSPGPSTGKGRSERPRRTSTARRARSTNG
jgi:enoyl-[acyl-carrier protein] reductase/trans-2-enoyl-CoA reductase (NAD+)